VRAPWRWDWWRITILAALWAAIWTAMTAFPILGPLVAVWFVYWVRATYRQPRSPTGVRTPSEGKKAGHRVVHSIGGGMTIVYPDNENVRTKL